MESGVWSLESRVFVRGLPGTSLDLKVELQEMEVANSCNRVTCFLLLTSDPDCRVSLYLPYGHHRSHRADSRHSSALHRVPPRAGGGRGLRRAGRNPAAAPRRNLPRLLRLD